MGSGKRLIRAAGGWDAVSVVFDIGANDGADFLSLARLHPTVRFVAIEPTPSLAEALRQTAANLSNYTVVQCAVSTSEGQAEFHIIDGQNGGLNSLHSPQPYLFEHWAAGEAIENVQVSTKRLDRLAADLGIDHIDVLHVDTQGSDLDALRSAGSLLETVKAGVVEVTQPEHRLYGGTPTPDDVARFLWDADFSIVRILPNDSLGAEKNILFARQSSGWSALYHRLYPIMFAWPSVFHPLVTGYIYSRRLRRRVALRTRWRRFRDNRVNEPT
jgi:FkbM family methyltransferase